MVSTEYDKVSVVDSVIFVEVCIWVILWLTECAAIGSSEDLRPLTAITQLLARAKK